MNINKMKYKSQITIFIIIAILVVAMTALVFMVSPKFKKAEEISEKVYCKSEQRNADVCISLYEPVCGFDKIEKQIKVFSNFCFACMDKNVEHYIAGECE